MNRQDTTIELYEKLSHETKQAMHLLKNLMRKSNDAEFSKELTDTYEGYRAIAEVSDKELGEIGIKPPKLSAMQKLSGRWTVGFRTAARQSNGALSYVVLRNFDKRNENFGRWEKRYINADGKAKLLCQAMFDLQQAEKRTYVRYLN